MPVFDGVDAALRVPDTALRLFGKPRVEGHRRVGVTLARGDDVDDARAHRARALPRRSRSNCDDGRTSDTRNATR